MHSGKVQMQWKNMKEMAEVEAAGMMAELQRIQRSRMLIFIPQIAFFCIYGRDLYGLPDYAGIGRRYF